MNDTISDTSSEEEGASTNPFFKTWASRWLVYRPPSALVWAWLLLMLFGRPITVSLPVSPGILLLPALVAWILLLFIGGWGRFAFYPLYVLLFPLLVLFYAIIFLAKLFSVPLKVGRFVTSGRLIVLAIIVIALGSLAYFLVPDPSVRAVASISALVALYILFLQSFRFAANPFRPLTGFFTFFGDQGEAFIRRTYIKPALEKRGQGTDMAIRVCNWIIRAIDYLEPSDTTQEGGLVGATRSFLVPTTIFAFILVFVSLAFAFALTIQAIEAAWGPQFTGLGDVPNLMDYLYFSILTQATVIPSGVSPLSAFGQILIIWIVLTGVLLLTLLLATFTTSVGIHGETAMNSIRDSLESERRRFHDWKVNLESEPDIPPEAIVQEVHHLPGENEEDSNS